MPDSRNRAAPLKFFAPHTLVSTGKLAVICLGCLIGMESLGAMAAPAQTPAELYFKHPHFTDPAVSPDGHSVAFITQGEGRAGLFRLDRATGALQALFTAGEGEIARFWWAGNRRVLLVARGVRNLEYFTVNVSDGKAVPIHALDYRDPSWTVTFPSDPDHVVSLNKRVDLTTGHSSTVENMTADFGYVYSPNGELRGKIGETLGKWRISWRAKADAPWHSLESSSEDWPPFTIIGVADDDRHLWVFANDQGDTSALMLLDPETDKRELVAQRPSHDVSQLVPQLPRLSPAVVEFYNNGPEDLTFLDEASKQFSAALDRSLPGMLHRVYSSSLDGNAQVIAAWLPGYPLHYFLFDATERKLSLLGEQRPDITAGALGQVRYFSFQTRDGLGESGHVLMPPSPRGDPPPLLVMSPAAVGEFTNSGTHYSDSDQFLASRGYAVARFAVRGNIGFGRKLQKAGDFQLANGIVHDLEDGVAYLAREHVIDSHRVAIMGYGMGGLAALHTAAVSSTFRAVVAYSPVCDLTNTSIGWLSSSHAEIPTIVKQAGGTKAAYELLHEFEPDSFMPKLSAPALLACSSWFGTNLGSVQKIRGSFDHHHKDYEWYQLDFNASDKVKWEVYNGRFYSKVVDYLDRTLK